MPDSLRFGPFLFLGPDVRRRLRAKAREVRLREGDVLIEEHRGDADAYLLIEGSLRVVANGERRTLALLGAPALVGEMAIVSGTERSATVVADTDCVLLRLPSEELRTLMTKEPLFATAMRERTDLLLADAFLKRRSPLRDLPADIVATLAARLRPRELAPDQLIEGQEDDIYLVRRGAVERMPDGERTRAGDFVQRERGQRYAAIGETAIYELRMSDVASEIVRHQEQVREIASRIGDRTRVRAADGTVALRDDDLGGALLHDAAHRAVVSAHIAELLPRLDGHTDIATLVRDSRRARGEIIEGLAMLVAAGLAEVRD